MSTRAVAPTGPIFVPGVAGEWLQAKTVEWHVWTGAEEADGMCPPWRCAAAGPKTGREAKTAVKEMKNPLWKCFYCYVCLFFPLPRTCCGQDGAHLNIFKVTCLLSYCYKADTYVFKAARLPRKQIHYQITAQKHITKCGVLGFTPALLNKHWDNNIH